MSKLKPCPFCGNHANSKWFKSDDFGIECNTKSCYGIYGFKTEEDAIAQWQSRPIEDTLRAELERLQEKLHDEMSQLKIATDLGNKRWIALNDIYENGEKHNTNWCKRKAQEGLGIK